MPEVFLNGINLGQTELQNALIQRLATDPSSPLEGQIWENSVSHVIKFYNGTSVVTLGASTMDLTAQTGILKGNGAAITAATPGTDYLAPTGSAAALTGFPTFNQNTTGTAAGLSGTPALPNGTTATTQANSDGSTKVATTAFVQSIMTSLAQGIQFKPTATVAATTALAAGAYANGTAGVGATFTVTATGVQTIDGHALALNDLVLLTAQASAFQNGLYTVTTAGASGISLVLTRHVDMDTAGEFSGAMIPVGSTGTAYGNSLWLANPSGTVTVGTTVIPMTELNKAADLIAGSGISISGNTISATGSGVAKYTALIGDGTSTSIAVTHNLGTQDSVAQIRNATTNAKVNCDIVNSSTTVTTFTFAVAPASNAYKVTIVG